jgi:ribonuclease E
MMAARNQRAVENRLRDAIKMDRARIQLGRISRFGLLEMSRQRLRPSLGESSLLTCPRCSGQGSIRSIESLALSVLRIIEEEAMKKNTARVVAHLPVESATFLLNEKRSTVQEIEQRHDVDVIVIPSKQLETPNYEIQRVRAAGSEEEGGDRRVSYQIVQTPPPEGPSKYLRETPAASAEPAVKEFLPPQPPAPTTAPPEPAKPASGGLIKRFWTILTGTTGHGKPEEEAGHNVPDLRTRPPMAPPPRGQAPRPPRGADNRPHRRSEAKPQRTSLPERPAATVRSPQVESRAPMEEANGESAVLAERQREGGSRRASGRRRRGRRGDGGPARDNHQAERDSMNAPDIETGNREGVPPMVAGYPDFDERAQPPVQMASEAEEPLLEPVDRRSTRPVESVREPKPSAANETAQRLRADVSGERDTGGDRFAPESDSVERGASEEEVTGSRLGLSPADDSESAEESGDLASPRELPRRPSARRRGRGRGRRDKRFGAPRGSDGTEGAIAGADPDQVDHQSNGSASPAAERGDPPNPVPVAEQSTPD